MGLSSNLFIQRCEHAFTLAMKRLVIFVLLCLAIAFADENIKDETNVEIEKRENIVSYVTSCLASKNEDCFYDEINKNEINEYLACIYKSISLDDAYVQKSIKTCLGPHGVEDIRFLISTMRREPFIHDQHLADSLSCLTKQLKTVSEVVEQGVTECLKDSNINEDLLTNYENATDIQRANIKKYYDCMKFKLGDKHKEIYLYVAVCPEKGNYKALFDSKNISSFQHDQMNDFRRCIYKRLGEDDLMVLKYITECITLTKDDEEYGGLRKHEKFEIGISQALDIDNSKISTVNEGTFEPAMKCVYKYLWDDVELLMMFMQDCMGRNTYDEVKDMFITMHKGQAVPRNQFIECMRDKLNNTKRRKTHEYKTESRSARSADNMEQAKMTPYFNVN